MCQSDGTYGPCSCIEGGASVADATTGPSDATSTATDAIEPFDGTASDATTVDALMDAGTGTDATAVPDAPVDASVGSDVTGAPDSLVDTSTPVADGAGIADAFADSTSAADVTTGAAADASAADATAIADGAADASAGADGGTGGPYDAAGADSAPPLGGIGAFCNAMNDVTGTTCVGVPPACYACEAGLYCNYGVCASGVQDAPCSSAPECYPDDPNSGCGGPYSVQCNIAAAKCECTCTCTIACEGCPAPIAAQGATCYASPTIGPEGYYPTCALTLVCIDGTCQPPLSDAGADACVGDACP